MRSLAEVNLVSKEEVGEPSIIDIEGNSREDGPGVRSVIFFKGCLLNCQWCQNPESKKAAPELSWDNNKCNSCADCIKVCPQAAISTNSPLFIDRGLCDLCFKCVDTCPYGALRRIGNPMTIDAIVQKVMRYKPFYDASGGGVTLSGGEPTLYMGFTSKLLKALKVNEIHTLIETAGQFDAEEFISSILPYTDMIYFDIKAVDAREHKRMCGVDNTRIMRNFTLLNNMSKSRNFDIVPRTPLIPGITDHDHQIDRLGEFYRKNTVKKACLLLNNPSWLPKLGKIGQVEPFDKDDPLRTFYDSSEEERIRTRLSSFGIDVSIGRLVEKSP